MRKHPKLKIRIVDGSSLAAEVVLHSIPVGTKEVLFRGQITKVARAIVFSLCQNAIKVPIFFFVSFFLQMERVKQMIQLDRPLKIYYIYVFSSLVVNT